MIKEAVISTLLLFTSPDGNPYPEACLRDLTAATPDTLILEISPKGLLRWNSEPEISRLYGGVVRLPGFPAFIIIDRTLGPEMRTRVLHHERCHIVAGPWHD